MTGFKHHEVIGAQFWDPERYQSAIAEFQDGMLGLQQAGVIEGAFVHGRAATLLAGGQPRTDERSDLDCVIIPTTKSSENLAAIRDVATGIYRGHYVELEPYCMTRAELATGDHTLEASIKNYMETFFRTQPENSPLTAGIRDIYISPPGVAVNTYPGEHDLDRYFRYRHDLEQNYLRGVFHDPHGELDHILRFPFETGREVTGHLNMLGMLPPELAGFWPNRETVVQAIDQLFSKIDPKLGLLYEDILDDGARYTGLMKEAYTGVISADEYDHIIEASLAYGIPKTLEITNRFRQVYQEYCRQHHLAGQVGTHAVALGSQGYRLMAR